MYSSLWKNQLVDMENIEKLSINEIRAKYPANFEKYKYVDSIIYGELPYILLGIDSELFVKQSFYNNPDKTTGSAIIDKLEEAKKLRTLIENVINSNNYDMLHISNIQKQYKKITGSNRSETLYYHTKIYIIECIKWLEYEHEIDNSFFLSLPDWFVEHHKNRTVFVSYNDLKKENATLTKENNELKEQLDKLNLASKDNASPKTINFLYEIMGTLISNYCCINPNVAVNNLPKHITGHIKNVLDNFGVSRSHDAIRKHIIEAFERLDEKSSKSKDVTHFTKLTYVGNDKEQKVKTPFW